MNGVGHIGMDVALFMAVICAAAVNLHYLTKFREYSKGIALMRLFRCTGWVILGTRFGSVLFTTGDLLISVHAATSVFFLAAGEIAAIFNRGKKVTL